MDLRPQDNGRQFGMHPEPKLIVVQKPIELPSAAILQIQC